MMAERIQRKRTKGWQMPFGTVYVGRPTKWGNPFYPGSGHFMGFFDENLVPCMYDVREPRVQVKWFRDHLRGRTPEWMEEFLWPLRGKDLACWCPLDQPCHADVLLELANATQEPSP